MNKNENFFLFLPKEFFSLELKSFYLLHVFERPPDLSPHQRGTSQPIDNFNEDLVLLR